MSGSASGSWWPISSESPRPDSQDSAQNTERDEVPIQAPLKSSSFWSWSTGSGPENQDSATGVSLVDIRPKAEEEVSWWTSILGPSTNAAGKEPTRNINETSDVTQKLRALKNGPSQNLVGTEEFGEQVTPQRSWFSWSFFSGHQDVDSDSESVDKRDIETFREAKSAIEAGKDSCHYAIYKPHAHLTDAYIAVQGTSSGQSPVRFPDKKQPVMPHQHLEKAMVDLKPSRPNDATNVPFKGTNGKSNYASSQSKTSIIGSEPTDIFNALQDTPLKNEEAVDGITNGIQSKSAILPFDGTTNPILPKNKISISPNLESNFRVMTLPTNLRLWGEALINKEHTSEKHIYKSTVASVNRKRKKVSKVAVVISIHSFLPTKFVRSVIGQSTGNASSIAASAATAIQRWAGQGGIRDLQVQSIALDGIGTIDARTNASIKLLRNWVSEINDADFVFVVTNSAACSVAVKVIKHMLESVEFELAQKKVGFLSISGGFHGPVTGLDAKVIRRAYSYNEYDIIKEMFDLQKTNSELSQNLLDDMSVLCQFNVKVTLVGSADDQFVPVFSSVCHQASHPNIFKCLYIDKNAEVPRFILRLLSIILTMENVGFSGHTQLLRDLSELSRGTMVSCASHGNLFTCPVVYDVGLGFTMETTSLKFHKSMALNQATSYADDSERNLYRLPWGARGLINDLLQIKHIRSAKLLKDLIKDYNLWDPSVRSWREIRQCFAAFEDASADDIML